jgi:hypothetical protein
MRLSRLERVTMVFSALLVLFFSFHLQSGFGVLHWCSVVSSCIFGYYVGRSWATLGPAALKAVKRPFVAIGRPLPGTESGRGKKRS